MAGINKKSASPISFFTFSPFNLYFNIIVILILCDKIYKGGFIYQYATIPGIHSINKKPIKRLSLRDPAGQLFDLGDQLIRIIHKDYSDKTLEILNSLQKVINSGKLISYRIIPTNEWSDIIGSIEKELLFSPTEIGLLMEHPKIFFVSFPFEWTPTMLYDAGKLTLEMALAALSNDISIKDASATNVLFDGPKPIFVDLLSFEKRHPNDMTWLPLSQFLRNFINPLLLYKSFGLGLDKVFIINRDGLESEDIYNMGNWLKRFSPMWLTLITIPTWLNIFAHKKNPESLYRQNLTNSPDRAKFTLQFIFKFLFKKLEQLFPTTKKISYWSGYMDSNFSFTPQQFEEKANFVERVLKELKPKTVLDIGCNTGYFSKLAAYHGAKVLAIDSDITVVDKTRSMALKNGLDIHSLVVNFSRPSPGIGWANSEAAPFLERIASKFDMIFMLAVIHHITITDGIPLMEVMKELKYLAPKWVILEYIEPQDRAFITLCRGRDFSYLTSSFFEKIVSSTFKVIDKLRLSNSYRTLYLLGAL